ncbi:MAG: 4-(cytidine 5'-diphospho)-2-C-methyl-D-erythritol kinase [Acidobacteria bacterium]|nr:4-(cytidine 5'-diphospho)-2-C-methyl-D-erythritol kinase [Acidobacteriota bacterium]
MQSLVLRSYAKVNLGLSILGRRQDGFHELRTVFQTIRWYDEIEVENRPSGLSLASNDPTLPSDHNNLILRAAHLLQQQRSVRQGAHFSVRKSIPVGAGLGGGSSNAAVTLLALNRLWNLKLLPRELASLGGALGSDVPFFLVGGTALGRGRGEILEPLPDAPAAHFALVHPGFSVPTASAYQLVESRLTSLEGESKIRGLCDAIRSASGVAECLFNDFEPPLFRLYPLLEKIKEQLLHGQARAALLSGSGSTIFGWFESPEAARRAVDSVRRPGWACCVADPVGAEEYRASLFTAPQGRRFELS